MRRFNLNDVQNGEPQLIAEGVEFLSGTVITQWYAPMGKVVIHRSVNEIPNTYEYGTLVQEWLDA